MSALVAGCRADSSISVQRSGPSLPRYVLLFAPRWQYLVTQRDKAWQQRHVSLILSSVSLFSVPSPLPPTWHGGTQATTNTVSNMLMVSLPFLLQTNPDEIAFYAGGIMPGTQNVHIFFFVIANAMLKIYILAIYMSQSFYGLNGGTHR